MSETMYKSLEGLGEKVDRLLELTQSLKADKARLEVELDQTRHSLKAKEAQLEGLESAQRDQSSFQTDLDERLGALQGKIEAFLNGG